ncbi:MAG TPA: hypothetical protein PLU26_14085, partial [Candidatus Competibacter sp.]|nr:hypothetical protein [Candidatus Competibacter sp.]
LGCQHPSYYALLLIGIGIKYSIATEVNSRFLPKTEAVRSVTNAATFVEVAGDAGAAILMFK